MAKSARASRVKTNRANLRKRIFNPADDARNERLSAKLIELAAQPKPEHPERMDVDTSKVNKKHDKTAKATEGPAPDSSMDVDEAGDNSVKISTSKKPRNGRVQKKRRGKATSTITFPAYQNGRKVNTRSRKHR